MSSFLDDLIRTIRAPLDAVRNKIWGIRSIEGRIQGDLNRIRSLPAEFKGEARNNLDAVKSYGQRAKQLKGQAAQMQQHYSGKAQVTSSPATVSPPSGDLAQPNGPGAPGIARGPLPGPPTPMRKAKMGLFSKKKKCPSCREKLHASWDLCPYCGYGAQATGPAPQQGGHPRTQALNVSLGGGGGAKGRTMALDGAQGSVSGHGGAVGWLVPLEGPQTGELFQLSGRCVIGTAPECEVIMRDPSISSRHAEFSAAGNTFRINDLGSTNGTYVNEKRVSNSDLVDGDNLRLGRTSFKFKSIG